jgi:hypothetical protein
MPAGSADVSTFGAGRYAPSDAAGRARRILSSRPRSRSVKLHLLRGLLQNAYVTS